MTQPAAGPAQAPALQAPFDVMAILAAMQDQVEDLAAAVAAQQSTIDALTAAVQAQARGR